MRPLFIFGFLIMVMGLLTVPFPGYSAEENFCEPGIVIFFGNGVWNDHEGAELSRRVLSEEIETDVLGTELEGLLTYEVAYNPTEGAISDLMETFIQNAETDFTKFWRYLSGLDPLPDILLKRLKEIANAVDESILLYNPAVQNHVNVYNSYLNNGKKVVVVAHSQGNLFANIAYTGIDINRIHSFGIVSVGNPDSYVAGNGAYTTLDEDIIIGAVPCSLPSNLDNFSGINLDDLTGHMFVKSYLATGHQAEQTILDNIISVIDELKFPGCELLIDFESLPDGSSPHVVDYHSAGYPGDPILENYAEWGVHFSQTGVAGSPAFSNYNFENNIYAFAWKNLNGYSDIVISFDLLVYGIRVNVSGAQMRTVTMTAYDADGNALGEAMAGLLTPYKFTREIVLSTVDPIASVKFTTGAWAAILLDDLHLNGDTL
ncbi:MAG: hypothetical protein V1793_17785 [Pseudomonadota bacterium]